MINRRSFFGALGKALAAVGLGRFAPVYRSAETIKAMDSIIRDMKDAQRMAEQQQRDTERIARRVTGNRSRYA